MSFYVNVSTSSEFRDGSKVYRSLWEYFHLTRASTRPDIQSRIKCANRMPIMASLADCVQGNNNWHEKGAGYVTAAIKKYYTAHADELNELITKASNGAKIQCCMMDKYISGNPHDFIGVEIRKIVESKTGSLLTAVTVSTTDEKTQAAFENRIGRTVPVSDPTTESKGDTSVDPDVTVVHFNPKPEEPSASTDDETFKQLNDVFWRSQNDTRLETAARRKDAPNATVKKMHERVRQVAKKQKDDEKQATELKNEVRNNNDPIKEVQTAVESVSFETLPAIKPLLDLTKDEEKVIVISISSAKVVPDGIELVISTKNATGVSIETGNIKSIYMPIDHNAGLSDEMAVSFFKTLFAIAVTKKVHVYATPSVAPFVRDIVEAAGYDTVHDIEDDHMDSDLEAQIESIIKALTS